MKRASDHVRALNFLHNLQVFLFIEKFFPPLKENSRKKMLTSQVVLPVRDAHVPPVGRGNEPRFRACGRSL